MSTDSKFLRTDKSLPKSSARTSDSISIDSSGYLELFEQVPVGLIEEDYSGPKYLIDSLGFTTSNQLRSYFLKNPIVVKNAILDVEITKINPAALKAYGASSREEFISDHRDIDTWLNNHWIEFFIDKLVALYDQTVPFQREFLDTSVSGDDIEIRNLTMIVPGYEQSWTRIVSIVEDISERKKVEAQLYQAQKMEAIGQLTSGLAHDVNNILAIISGNVELLDEQLPEENARIKEISHAINTGSSLVKQLLSFSKKQDLDPKVIDVNALTERLINLLKHTIGPSIEIKLKKIEGAWLVKSDPNRLENALLNLVINARDAMPDGGMLTIESKNEILEQAIVVNNQDVSAGEYVSLSVIDNGTGMSKDELAKAFDPFFTTKDIGSGSGLGLSSVYGFIKQMGGHITILSTRNFGTEVRLYLPRSAQPKSPLPEYFLPKMSDSKGKVILVLEDEVILSNLVKTMLQDFGYQVLIAQNGLEALDILANTEKVDLMVSDIGLPGGLSGFKVAEKAIEIQPGLNILFMSGYVSNNSVSSKLMEQFGPVLDKPFRKSDLAKRVREVLDSDGINTDDTH